jgi:hypothetical protein
MSFTQSIEISYFICMCWVQTPDTLHLFILKVEL